MIIILLHIYIFQNLLNVLVVALIGPKCWLIFAQLAQIFYNGIFRYPELASYPDTANLAASCQFVGSISANPQYRHQILNFKYNRQIVK